MMKKILFSILFTATCFAQSIGKDNNAFALSLFSTIEKKNENLAFSPYSIFSNLSLLYFGAKGDTAEEIRHALHLSHSGESFLKAFQKLQGALTQNSEEGYQLHLANGLFLNKDFPLLSSFQTIAKNRFSADIEEVDFHDKESALREVNDWVFKKTDETIPSLLDESDIDPTTRLIIANAVYFQGKWQFPFQTRKTCPAPFYLHNDDPIEIDMMEQTHSFSYFEDQEVQGLILPFKRSGPEQPLIECVLLLPRNGLQNLEESLTSKKLHKWIGSSELTYVDVQIPIFSFSKELSLNASLTSLGMQDAFTDKADFSKITGQKNLFLNSVLHETYFSFNEDGVTAAAATATQIGVTSVRPEIEPVTPFIANRPFLFLLIDYHSGAILFMGHVMNPKTNERHEN